MSVAENLEADLGPLGIAVREARNAKGWTLKALAEECGVSLRFLSDLEHGRGNISVARLLFVSRALQTPIAELVAPLDRAPAASRTGPVVALVGLRGAGKSTIGARVAAELDVPFKELDLEIESRAGLPAAQIFEIHGESYYRRIEKEALKSLVESSRSACVIAAGGGVVTDSETWRLLRARTKTIWLKASPQDHYERVMAQGDLRPMENRPSAMAELRTLLGEREELYSEAAFIVDTSALGLERSVERVLQIARTS